MYNVIMESSEKIKIIQQISGLTQNELAGHLGVSFAALNRWVNNHAKPRKSALIKIDNLYREYTGQQEIPRYVLQAKKSILAMKRQGGIKVIKTIMANPDIKDQLLLDLTYQSNKIEGSTLTENETAAILFQNASLPNHTLSEQLEAKNHQTALVFLFDHLYQSLPINEELILRLHAILMNGIRNDAGFYRHQNVRIVGANVPTANHLKVPQLMNAFAKRIKNSVNDIIAQAAIAHGEFEQIHPFSDGNGRIGRLILLAMLIRSNLAPAIIEQKKKVFYLQYLNIAQTKNDLSPWENFLCDAILQGYKIIERSKAING
jgi:Fic family protein